MWLFIIMLVGAAALVIGARYVNHRRQRELFSNPEFRATVAESTTRRMLEDQRSGAWLTYSPQARAQIEYMSEHGILPRDDPGR